MKVLDLFSGIAGVSRGLEAAGMTTVAFCEMDLHARAILKKHYPDTPIFGDIKGLYMAEGGLRDHSGNTTIIKDIDLICGGYPCTGHSVAGKKEGLQNEASGLWTEYKRLISNIRPKYVLIENSHNLRSTGLVELLKDFDALGYSCEFSVINAYSVGAPFQRERLYILAWRRDVSYCDPFRSWNANSEEAKGKQDWWAKGWIERSPLFEQGRTHQPRILRVDNGFPTWLHRINEERIKRLGNSVVPKISELIGRQIMLHQGE
jgi:DNA (cytosine-5)-methyltransferase 1